MDATPGATPVIPDEMLEARASRGSLDETGFMTCLPRDTTAPPQHPHRKVAAHRPNVARHRVTLSRYALPAADRLVVNGRFNPGSCFPGFRNTNPADMSVGFGIRTNPGEWDLVVGVGS